jgi:Cdc6-like AAA superfamily ATPase
VFFNCQDTVIPPTINNFWHQTTKQLHSKLENSPIQDKCRSLIARFAEGLELNHNNFHEILDVVEGANKRIILVLDDFDYLIRTDTENLDKIRIFLQGLRSLTTRD